MKNNPIQSQFSKPLLSKLYEISGTICLVAATLPALGGILALFEPHHTQTCLVAFGIALAVAFIGLLQLGFAQVVTAIVETAFNTRRQ
jgi:hypothetical protein